jgi:hypothetical protein
MFIYVLYVLYDQISLVMQDTKHVETPAPAPSCGIGWFTISELRQKNPWFYCHLFNKPSDKLTNSLGVSHKSPLYTLCSHVFP